MFKFLQLLPTILQAVIAVNGIIGRGKGQTKKKIILDAITTGSDFIENIDNKTVKAISRTIDIAVATLNAAGIFETNSPKTNAATGDIGAN